MKLPSFLSIIFLAGLGGNSALAATGTKQAIGDPNTSTSTVEMRTVFSHLPPMGYAPVRVIVRNDTGENLGFTLNTSSKSQGGGRDQSSHDAEFPIVAQKSQTSVHTFLAPVCTVPGFGVGGGGRGYGGSGNLNVRINGAAAASFNEYEQLNSSQPPCAFSTGLTKGKVNEFNQDRAKSLGTGASYGNDGSYAAEFEMDQLPDDWRAFSGFASVAFSTEEWLRLAPAVRSAALQWVEFGGWLSLYSQSDEKPDTLQLGQIDPASKKLGAGFILIRPWDGKMLDKAHLAASYGDHVNFTRQLNSLKVTKDNHLDQLQKLMQKRSFAAWQVGVILVIFGILVGPVNLFYFARAGQRHRLFFTTPIISIAASLILIATILLQDGTGGQGVRTAVIHVNPASATASISQDQISRTGVLFSSGFSTEEPAVVSPLLLPDTQWTRVKSPGWGSNSPAQRYSQSDPKNFAGDWFQSRSEQGQSVQNVRSSRGRLELISANPPTLRSSMAYPLEKVFFADEKGALWQTSAPLDTGGTAVLSPAKVEEIFAGEQEHRFVKHPLIDASHVQHPNHFYAFTTSPKADFVPSLSTITWSQNHALVYGPVVRALAP